MPSSLPPAAPGQAPTPAPPQETVFYSPDGLLSVYILGTERAAHLYSNSPDLTYVADLGSGVKDVEFIKDFYMDGATAIRVTFTNGHEALYDPNGIIYRPEQVKTPEVRERMDGVLNTLPPDIQVPAEAPPLSGPN